MKKSKKYIHNIRVIYGDTDKMGVVYYARYLYYFEAARNELLRGGGLTYKSLEEEGLLLPVIESKVNYHKPARYDDMLELRSHAFQEADQKLILGIHCDVYNDGGLLVSGHTKHVFTDIHGKISRRGYGLLEKLWNGHNNM